MLIATRWMFPRTVFHFHAAGLPNLYKRLPRPLKILFRLAYNHPDVAISISQDGVRDANFLKARHTALVPNGIPDVWQNRPMHRQNPKPMILFLAMVCEEKGVGILIEACKILKSRRQEFSCKIVGRASSEQELANLREKAGTLCDCIEFIGAVTGDTKWKLFEKADIFCFPTFYASESFGLVVVEAMMAGLPVVATNWRALPEIVVDGQTGFLVPVQDSTATADKLEHLLRDATLRQIMGEAARSRFLEHYRVETFQSGMEKALLLAWHDGNQDHLND